MKKIELSTIQGGAVIDMFNEELKRVLANIEDENTVASQERSITIKIAVKPDKTRRAGEVKTQVSSTLARIKPAESLMFFDRDADGKFTAYADDPGPELPGISESENITPFQKASNGG